ncbi:MAG: Gfo/Idh/MocA family oxidoreductase [Planctomycetaceae bacterium]|jgi:predicted dehydrogenase|nr:Gfo/Idh/MocA family oxidoreductase [Planctomycetaceae bacterium]
MTQKNINRRRFLQESTTAVTTIALTPYFFSSAQLVHAESIGNRLRLAQIGTGDIARTFDVPQFDKFVDIVAACDIDSSHLQWIQNNPNIGAKDSGGNRIKIDTYKDYRKILDRKDIDIVSICTPDHWHTKIAIEALQAGKHVYCQKPLTLTIEECQKIRAACKKYNQQVFQVGTQQRSFRDQFLIALLMVRKGLLGNVKRIICDLEAGEFKFSGTIPKAEVPETFDYETWLGQTPLKDYLATKELADDWRASIKCPNFSRGHFNFRYWYEYGGGQFSNWGAHHFDIAMWMIDQVGPNQGPTKIKPIHVKHPVPFKNGYPTIDNAYNIATEFHVECHFPNGVVIEARHNTPDGNGILVEGTKGRIHVNRSRIKGKPYEEIGGGYQANGRSKPYSELPEIQKLFPEEDFVQLYKGKPFEDFGWNENGHKKNFIRCIREGGLPVSDVFTTVQVTNVCHLAVIAARLGREIEWDPKTEKTGDTESMTFLAREQRKGYEIPNV